MDSQLRSPNLGSPNLAPTRADGSVDSGRPLLLDGGIGCWARLRGGRVSADPLGDPAQVRALHRAYALAGSVLLRTASFALPSAIVRGMPESDAALALRASVAWAAGASRDVLVSLGPTSLDRDASDSERARPYADLARALLAAPSEPVGATPLAVVLETFRSLAEVSCALDGLSAGGYDGDVWAILSPTASHELRDADLAHAGERLARVGVSVAGIGCTTAEVALDEALAALAGGFGGPLVLTPAGRRDGRVWAQDTARIARVRAVRWVGGCCGAAPSHVSALRAEMARAVGSTGESSGA